MTTVLFFGELRDAAGPMRDIPIGADDTVASLRARLSAENPDLGALLKRTGVRAAVDQIIVGDQTPLSGAREVAFMPPMSGG